MKEEMGLIVNLENSKGIIKGNRDKIVIIATEFYEDLHEKRVHDNLEPRPRNSCP